MIVIPKKIDNLFVDHFQSNFTSQSSYHNHNLTSLLGIFYAKKWHVIHLRHQANSTQFPMMRVVP
jgi:hypothetical protein